MKKDNKNIDTNQEKKIKVLMKTNYLNLRLADLLNKGLLIFLRIYMNKHLNRNKQNNKRCLKVRKNYSVNQGPKQIRNQINWSLKI